MKQSYLIIGLVAVVLCLSVALVFALRPRNNTITFDSETAAFKQAYDAELAKNGTDAQKLSCASRLKQLALAVAQFTQDNNEKYPDLSNPAVIRAQLQRYVMQDVFSCSTSQQPFRGNPALSLKGLNEIADPSRTILLYETDGSHPDGCNVAYADGSVKWLDRQAWLSEKQKNGLS